jgi:hypothetical protein
MHQSNMKAENLEEGALEQLDNLWKVYVVE